MMDLKQRFLDIFKTFEKVWYHRFVFKLRLNSILEDLVNKLSDFLSNKKHKVVLNGRTSSWAKTTAGVPKECTLGTLVIFNLYK